jgi:hypothetical protein
MQSSLTFASNETVAVGCAVETDTRGPQPPDGGQDLSIDQR